MYYLAKYLNLINTFLGIKCISTQGPKLDMLHSTTNQCILLIRVKLDVKNLQNNNRIHLILLQYQHNNITIQENNSLGVLQMPSLAN